MEDELLVSIGLRNMINWESMDMQVVGDAPNGEAALAMYHELSPDLILTDIKMPLMDGMQLIEEIRKNDAKTKIIILTCVQEFDSLRRAMQLMVSDYILKLSMSVEEMTSVISKIRAELDSEGQQHAAPLPADTFAAARRILRDFAYYNAISCDEFRIAAERIQLPEQGLVACFLQALRPKGDEQDDEHGDMYGSVLYNLLTEHMQREGCGAAVKIQDGLYLIVFGIGYVPSAMQRQSMIHALLGRLSDKVSTYLDTGIRMGVSTVGDGYAILPTLCIKADKALTEAYYAPGLPCVIFDGQEGPAHFSMMLNTFMAVLLQENEISSDCQAAISEALASLYQMYGAPYTEVWDLFERLIHRLAMLMQYRGEQWLAMALETASDVRAAENLLEVLEIFRRYLRRLSLRAHTVGHVSREVGKAMQYIYDHYAEDISLQQVADYVEMSANYLSSLFKKELDVGFVDYLNRVRIEKAGQMLLSTNMKTYEIAAAVGFSDESYFSRIFKRIKNVRPREYKKTHTAHLPEDSLP